MLQQFKQIEDSMFIGPQPMLSDLEGLRQLGVSTVIDLRHPSEVQTSNAELAKQAGLDYVNIPIRKATISANDIADFLHNIKTKTGKFLVHCGLGPRAFLMVLLKQAVLQGWSPETLLMRLREGGLNMRANAEFVEFAENYLRSVDQLAVSKEHNV